MENLTVVVPFFNGHATIDRLVKSIPLSVPVVIVDDQSDRPLNDLKRKNVRVLRPDNKGYFSGAVNAGISACNTDVLVLNQDTYLEGTSALDLIASKRDTFAMIGERIVGNHPAWPRGYIHGTFMYMRRDAIDAVGLLDTKYYPLWGATGVWQAQICRAGFRALPVPDVPGFVHIRKPQERFGSAIQTLLERQPELKEWLVRTPPMISVVIPCYNHGKYLPDLINSLIGGPSALGHRSPQTFQGFEVVIVNDGSTDNSLEIMKSLADPWRAIRVVNRPNGGTGAANNTGVRHALGRVISVVGADDMMEPERLEIMYDVWLKNQHSVICDNMKLWGRGGIYKDAKGNPKMWRMPNYDFEVLIKRNIIHAGIMFSKKAWQEAGGYPEITKYGREDWAFNIALGIVGYCGVNADTHGGYLYRREGQNRTIRNTTPDWRAFFAAQMRDLFPRIYSGVRPMSCCGGAVKSVAANVAKSKQGVLNMVGAEGMVLVQYAGKTSSDMPWYGKVTKQQYYAGGNRRQIYVDQADVQGFLEIYDNGKPLFTLAPKPASSTKATLPEKEYVPEEQPTLVIEAEAEVEAAVIDVLPVPELPVRDPVDFKVSEFRQLIETTSFAQDEILAMLAKEEAGKARKSIIALLEDALGE